MDSKSRESAGTIFLYIHDVFTKIMVNIVGLPKDVVSWINFIALLVFVVLQLITGMLSDRIGRRPLLIWFGILGILLTVSPFLIMEQITYAIVTLLPLCSRLYRYQLHHVSAYGFFESLSYRG